MFRTSLVFVCALTVVGCKSDSSLSNVEEAYVAPVLTVDGPAAGAFLPDTSSKVHGTAIGLTDITVNGTTAVIEGDTFESTIGLERGINRIEVRGVDGRGDSMFQRHSVLAGDYADPSQTMKEAVNLRLNQGGLDVACDLISDAIDPSEVSSSVIGTTVYEDAYGILGWNAAEVSATLQSLTFDRIQADLEPGSNRLHLTIDIPDLDTWINASGEVIGYGFDVDAFVWADVVTIESDLFINVIRGELDVEISEPTIVMTGFGYDTSLIPTEIETLVFVDEVRGYLEGMLVEKVEEMVPALVDEQLATLDFSFETELMEQQLKLDAEFDSIDIDNNGIALTVDVDISLGGEEIHDAPGYLSAPSESADLSTKSDLAIGLSDNVFNRVLYGIWQAGILDMTMSTADESLSETVAGMLKAEEATVQITPALPPVMIQRDGALTLEVGELLVTIDTPNGEFGDHLEAAISGTLPLEIVGEENEIFINLGDADLEFMVRTSDWGTASNEVITNMFTAMLDPTVLMATIGDISFPIPTLSEGVDVASIRVDPAEAEYNTGIRINLQ